jgi:NACalpha-BTF3-like transcription factor
MTSAEAEAKQLDSVTDRVDETELDASKAQQAMSALSSANQADDSKAMALAAVTVSEQGIDVIVDQLEVSRELAEKTLREVALETKGEEVLVAALRRLVHS